MIYKTYKLCELYEFKSGLSKSRKNFGYGYDFLTFKDVFNNYFLPEKLSELVNSSIEERKQMNIKRGDVFLTRTSETHNELGMSSVALKDYENATFNGFTKRLRPKKNGVVIPEYAGYYFRSPKFRNMITSLSSMTTRASLNNSMLEILTIDVPSKNKQIEIANILSSLDNKIENNNAIIANLEAQAQAIFKSWFIDFDPFQNGKFVDSELGKIPEGWGVGKLGNSPLGKLIKSGIDNFEKEKIYLATADVIDNKIINYKTKITFDSRPSRANMQPQKNSIWFAKMKDSRKLIYVGNNDYFLLNKAIFSTGFAGIKSTLLGVNYLWSYLLTNDFNTKKDLLSNGTTMQAINNNNINKIKIVIPKENILEDFNNIVKPIFELLSVYKYQNIKLANLRDTLLPKLMSGEIRVGQDDID